GRFWMEHQDASLGESPVAGHDGYRYLLNYEREDVRAYRMAVIVEAMNRYADVMDGFEIDFNRFQVFFPLGTAEKNRHHITTMLEEIRQRIDVISKEQKRPMQLIVRVPPTIKNCDWSGLDVAEWMKMGLIDMVIPAQVMTLSHDMPLDEFVKLAIAAGSKCRVIGSLYGRTGYTWPFNKAHNIAAYEKEVSRTPTPAQFLGAALNQRYLGASGHQIYNYILHKDKATCQVLTSPAGARRFQITQGYFLDKEDSYEYRKQVPVAMETGVEKTFQILIGEDLSDTTAFLRLGLNGANQAYADVTMKVSINGQLLHDGATKKNLIVTTGKRHGNGSHAPPTEAYLQWPLVKSGILRKGWNEINVSILKSPKALQLVEAEVAVSPKS
ncbi:MAG: hypothetical protein KAG66_13220, partial [Methylococcales bacterium]|nr:hypothetical protein [Methylococcales bacterium]